MGEDEHVCPECGQSVATVVRRRKTLGAYVPVWSPGACQNPECGAYGGESRQVPQDGSRERIPEGVDEPSEERTM